MNTYSAWAVIDIEAFSHNLMRLRGATAPGAMFMAVVKANAYGHGAIELARRAAALNADWLAVAGIEEAVALRTAGIGLPILIFGHTPADMAQALIENRLTPTLFSLEAAEKLARHLPKQSRLNVHIKVDTGMGRLGMMVTDDPKTLDAAASEIRQIAALSGIRIQGLYTHFAEADAEDKTFTRLQLDRFRNLVAALADVRITPEIAHAANSAAVIDLPETHLDMVRPGISLFGAYPSDAVNRNRVRLKPVMSLKTRIIQVKAVPKGFPVSYSRTYVTHAPTTIATVPIGYADGYNRLFSSQGHMLVNGCKASVAGRVTMDLTLLDVGQVPGVAVGDEVVVMGAQQDLAITAEEMAKTLGTISYEIFTRISERVKRIYHHR